MNETRWKPAASWRFETDWPIVDLSLAVEPRRVLVRNQHHQLELLDATGSSIGFWISSAPLVAAKTSADGSAVVALSTGGRLTWLCGTTLEELWNQETLADPQTLAVDTTGWYVAVADRAGELLVLDCHGQAHSRFRSPVPLTDLVFSQETDWLVACGTAGFIGALTLAGELVWQQRSARDWRILAVSAHDDCMTLDSDGSIILPVDRPGQLREERRLVHSAQGIDLDATGEWLLSWHGAGHVALLRRDSLAELADWNVRQSIVRAILDSLGRSVWLGYVSGTVERWDLQPAMPVAPVEVVRHRTVCYPRWSMQLADRCALDGPLRLAVTDHPTRGVLIDALGQWWVVRNRSSARQGQVVHQQRGAGPPVSETVSRAGLVVVPCRDGMAWYGARHNASTAVEQAARGVVDCDASAEGVAWITGDGNLVVHERRGELRFSKRLDRNPCAVCMSREAIWVGFDDGEIYQFDLLGAPLRHLKTKLSGPLRLLTLGSVLVVCDEQAGQLVAYSLAGALLWERALHLRPRRWSRGSDWVVARGEFGEAVTIDDAGEMRRVQRIAARDESWSKRRAEQTPMAAWGTEQTVYCGDFAGRVIWRAECEFAVRAVAANETSVAAIAGSTWLWFTA